MIAHWCPKNLAWLFKLLYFFLIIHTHTISWAYHKFYRSFRILRISEFSNWQWDRIRIVPYKYIYILFARVLNDHLSHEYISSCQSSIKLTSAHPKAQRHRHDRPPSRHRATSMIHDDDDLREIPALLHSTHLIRTNNRDLTRVVLMCLQVTQYLYTSLILNHTSQSLCAPSKTNIYR